MAIKSDDWSGAYGCHPCHVAMDHHKLSELEEAVYWLRGIQRTQRRLYEKGIMTFPERTSPPKVVNKVMPRKPSWRTSA